MRAITSKAPMLETMKQDQKTIVERLLLKGAGLRPDARELHELLISKAPTSPKDRVEAWVAANPRHVPPKTVRKPPARAKAGSTTSG